MASRADRAENLARRRARRLREFPAFLQLIAAMVEDAPRLPQALCRDWPDLFDGTNTEDRRFAAELCSRCPDLAPCKAWATSAWIRRTAPVAGVIAGRYRRGPEVDDE